MSTMTLNSLVEKLTMEGRTSLEMAAGISLGRSHFTIELQHWLLAMCDSGLSEFRDIAQHFGLDMDLLTRDLNLSLEQAKTGNDVTPGLSAQIVSVLRSAWMASTIEFDDQSIAPVHIIYALLNDDALVTYHLGYMRQLEKIQPQQLLEFWKNYRDLEPNQTENSGEKPSGHLGELEKYTLDLTAQAAAGRLDPIVGRDDEVRQMIDILTRRRQNNPILTGEAGVGKTAVVEGLAQRIADKKVPESLSEVSIRVLDLALLQAGAGMKGEFEKRLKAIISEISSAAQPIILFIDEAHTMIGSGGQAGQNDAANLLKPALARGELRTIAATTWAEYKKYFEKDAALARRFQVIKVEEPDEDTAIMMLRGLLPVLEKHHNVTINDAALQAAVRLSNRYINGRQLPDKAVSLLDTACARVAMSQASTPSFIEATECQQTHIHQQLDRLTREFKTGAENAEQRETLKQSLSKLDDTHQTAVNSWQQELTMVENAKALSDRILNGELSVASEQDARQQLTETKASLAEAKRPMVFFEVDDVLVAEVVADWTGIPLGRMQNDELKQILDLESRMRARIAGQDHALSLISKVVQTSYAKLSDENKPNGVFLLTGPSGTGKTETALALAELVYGSEDSLTTINMSEFKEEHKVSLLLGSPPGYVGYGEGGVLTEAVRRRPYSVVLLDEMEKAHSGVQDIFYQVFDKGTIKDGEGRDIDFKNTIIIMTSNVGTETTVSLCEDEATAPDIEGLKTALQDDLLGSFKPAFIGRLNLIPYMPLSQKVLENIAILQLQRVAKRFDDNYGKSVEFNDNVVRQLVFSSFNVDVGARAIHSNIQNRLLPRISRGVLDHQSNGRVFSQVIVDYIDDEYEVSFK
ncbi:type VI secretion system ATPase TssH [Vibrio sp. SCSIO 43136]|uniref:type VI secretion system ATPase TssH n=1 Tax=Vibrio sp. SCSIO 43136 TaxID=2819101 RepID=UPI002075F738|nr:type VI secretion system ATPase TssH [Vibrio sp. SCSIO 43136]USD67518.1 type VI secretion system ATPase TssH [Vibrio sp. SCSIO 43136]